MLPVGRTVLPLLRAYSSAPCVRAVAPSVLMVNSGQWRQTLLCLVSGGRAVDSLVMRATAAGPRINDANFIVFPPL